MEVKIIRSKRRFRTVSARLDKNTLLVNAPLMLSKEKLERIVSDFRFKFERKRIKEELEKRESLLDIAAKINQKYFNNGLKVNSIKYVCGQNSKFGCCNCRTGHIRISHKIGMMPKWVRNYVVIHEMAHLIEPNHSKAFWNIVGRYKLAERARGYLMAQGSNER